MQPNKQVTNGAYVACMCCIGIGLLLWLCTIWGLISDEEIVSKSVWTLVAVVTASLSVGIVQGIFGYKANRNAIEKENT